MKTKTKELKCSDKVKDAFQSRMRDIRTLWNAEHMETEELGHLNDYGLCLDLVEAGTFKGQREDYKRYQLSYGGPTEEFRVYKNGEVEFWYLDWFDGASVEVSGKDAEIIGEIVALVEW